MESLLLWLGAGGGLAGLSTLVWYVRHRSKKKKQEKNAPPPKEPPKQEELPKPPEEPPKKEEPPKPLESVSEKEIPKNPGQDAQVIIRKILENVPFSAKRVLVGRRVVGQKALGVEYDEVLYPADDINVRPIANSAELGNLLPSELQNEEMLLARLATSEALVAIPVEDRIITEDIYEEVWEDQRRILYLLLDISPSMFPGCSNAEDGRWRPFIWKPLVVRLLWHAIQNEAIFLSRKFYEAICPLRRAINEKDAKNFEKTFTEVNMGKGTDIPNAIGHAISDFESESEKYDQGEIVIVTDGENNYDFNPPEVKARLTRARLKLHAILLGAQNEALRACADSYQIVEEVCEGRFILHALIKK